MAQLFGLGHDVLLILLTQEVDHAGICFLTVRGRRDCLRVFVDVVIFRNELGGAHRFLRKLDRLFLSLGHTKVYVFKIIKVDVI